MSTMVDQKPPVVLSLEQNRLCSKSEQVIHYQGLVH